jgi:hypothetical protein
MNSTQQSCLLTLIKHFHQLEVASPQQPRFTEQQALDLDACARVSIADVSDTLELLSDLISHYSEDAGAAEHLFPKCANALRLLSGVLVVADQIGEHAADALRHIARQPTQG